MAYLTHLSLLQFATQWTVCLLIFRLVKYNQCPHAPSLVVTYDYEVYTDAAMTNLVTGVLDITETTDKYHLDRNPRTGGQHMGYLACPRL